VRDLRKSGAALFALVLLVWLPSLWNGFVWDDINNLVNTDRLQHWNALVEVFKHNAMWSADRPQPPIGTYRPLSLASFVLDFQIWDRNAWGFHLTSIALHALGALLIFRLFARWLASPWPAFALAFLWAVHPIDAEAVAWINGRSESLTLIFGVAALIVVSAPELRIGRVAAAAVLLWLAMLGKEVGGVFVPIAVLLAGEATGIAAPGRRPWRRIHWPMVLAGLCAIVGYGLMRHHALEGGLAAGMEQNLGAFKSLPAVWIRALEGVFFPIDLAVANLHLWLTNLPAGEFYAYTAASAAIVGLAVLLWWRGERVAVIGLLWWLISLTPIALTATSNWPGFHRWLYAGLPGLLLAVWLGGLQRVSLRGQAVALGLVLLPFLVQTERGIRTWHDDGHLFGAMIDEQPEEPFGYTGLGAWLLREGRYADAEKVLEQALQVGSNRPEHYLFLGMAKAELGRCAEAYKLARDHTGSPDELPTWFLLSAAGCFVKNGQGELARPLYQQCAPHNQTCAQQLAGLPPASDAPPSAASAGSF
jgi:hypothetical protein